MCTDFTVSHRISVVSAGYLQYLEPIDKVDYHGDHKEPSENKNTDMGYDFTTLSSRTPDVTTSRQETVAMDTQHSSMEFQGSPGYILTEPTAVATGDVSDSNSELIMDYGDSPLLGYTYRNPHDLSIENGIGFREKVRSIGQESLSDATVSISSSGDAVGTNMGASLDEQHSSSASDCVQSNASNVPKLTIPSTSQGNIVSVLELDPELNEEQSDGYQPQFTTLATNHSQTAGYLDSEHFSSPNVQNKLYSDSDQSDSCFSDDCVMAEFLDSNDTTVESNEVCKPRKCPVHSSSTNGYIQNEQQQLVSATFVQDNGGNDECIDMSFDVEYTNDSPEMLPSDDEELPDLSSDNDLDKICNLDIPNTPPTNISTQGYVLCDENASSLEPFTRENITAAPEPVSIISPSKTESNFTVHLSFDGDRSYQHQLSLESGFPGMEIGLNNHRQHMQCHNERSDCVTNESVRAENDCKGQYISYDFVPLMDELRSESSDYLGAVNNEAANDSVGQNQNNILVSNQQPQSKQPQSNYYPSDVSSGYLSSSSVSGDTSVYIS